MDKNIEQSLTELRATATLHAAVLDIIIRASPAQSTIIATIRTLIGGLDRRPYVTVPREVNDQMVVQGRLFLRMLGVD